MTWLAARLGLKTQPYQVPFIIRNGNFVSGPIAWYEIPIRIRPITTIPIIIIIIMYVFMVQKDDKAHALSIIIMTALWPSRKVIYYEFYLLEFCGLRYNMDMVCLDCRIFWFWLYLTSGQCQRTQPVKASKRCKYHWCCSFMHPCKSMLSYFRCERCWEGHSTAN